jgi:hypothetical protein
VSGHAGAWAPDGARGDGEEVRAPEHVTELEEVHGDVRESADELKRRPCTESVFRWGFKELLAAAIQRVASPQNRSRR